MSQWRGGVLYCTSLSRAGRRARHGGIGFTCLPALIQSIQEQVHLRYSIPKNIQSNYRKQVKHNILQKSRQIRKIFNTCNTGRHRQVRVSTSYIIYVKPVNNFEKHGTLDARSIVKMKITNVGIFGCRQATVRALCSAQTELKQGHILAGYHSVPRSICRHQAKTTNIQ